MFNPFSVLVNTVKGVAYFVFHPKELAKALVDPKSQAIYHTSSINTAVGAGVTSAAYPNWARDLARSGKEVANSALEWIATDGYVMAKTAVDMVKEFSVS